ncbi:retrovirus-related pol polyprotein from transposon tnt 1-94 [Lasius niger]|uniref:Retrovirus-related pol polyprotein from transposon tnt 1-94 n=1 Tax=Lasius niger TaxID=67767 RepID=A0A0J7KBD6_LASNI|nr:retrovirus-related pol polyprotein from transposon tnt 1-94 [Lasius niger]
MASSNTVRIEFQNKENYDTWKIQMQALLTKNEAWAYVSGQKLKPEVTPENREEVNRWILDDEKAKADIILSIKPSQLKQIKECRTSRELWLKLQSIYQSSGPARKGVN